MTEITRNSDGLSLLMGACGMQRVQTSRTAYEEAEAAAEALRYWFKLDTWTLREGLLLLVGIDPHRSECITIDENGKGFQFEGKGHPAPYWSRIGYPPDLSWTEEDMRAGRQQPTITGLIYCPDDAFRLWELLNIWHANPELEGLNRAHPMRFITLAESKGLAPYWLEAAREKGILPACEPTPQFRVKREGLGAYASLQNKAEELTEQPVKPAQPKTPRRLQREQEEAIIKVIRDELGYDPKALPENTPGHRGVKSDVKTRVLRDPLFKAKTSFKRAWEQLFMNGDMAYSQAPHKGVYPQKNNGGLLRGRIPSV